MLAPYALGSLVVGMSGPEAEATGLVTWEEPQGIPPYWLHRSGQDVFVGGNWEAGITGFLVKGPGFHTPEGISPNRSTVTDLRRAFGGRLDRQTTAEGLDYYRVRSGDFGYYFEPDHYGDSGLVVSMIGGQWSSISRLRPGQSFWG